MAPDGLEVPAAVRTQRRIMAPLLWPAVSSQLATRVACAQHHAD